MSNSKQQLISSIHSFFEKEGVNDENFKVLAEMLKSTMKEKQKSDYSLEEIFEEGEKVLKQTKPQNKNRTK